jgi:ribonuclease HII
LYRLAKLQLFLPTLPPMGKLLLYKNRNLIEAGCDEAGRGCLAGPVVAAAVILPADFSNDILDDSKKLTEAKRNKLRPIIEKEALAFAVAFVSEKEIDEINILNASFLAMHRAVAQLNQKPEMLLIDGNRFTIYEGIPHECIIKGDGKFLSIAAASILAKTYRDEYMENIHEEFPFYDWKQNKGYPTKKHRKAILEYGDCIHHRKTFTLLPEDTLSLF